MDYKKKYENALEWARQVINGECGFIRKEVEEVFPELKESEDEKVRKAIVELVLQSSEILGSNNQSRMLAWLEKQGESNPYSGVSFEYDGHIWGMCARDNGVDILCDKRIIEHLEKQGKQNCEFHGIAESRPAKGTLKKLVDEIENVDNANKVEPKFKIGQRIKQGNTIAEIKEISKDGYHCDIAFVPFTAEDNWELSLWNEDDDKMLYECKKEIWKSAPTMLSFKHEKIEQWLESLKQRFKQAMEGK